MKWPRLSLRWRITLWNVLLLGAALVVLGVAFYFGLRYLLYDALESRLESQMLSARAAMTVDGERLAMGPGAAPENDEQFVRLTDASGVVIFDTSGELDRPAPNPEGVSRALDGEPSLTWVRIEDDDMRILAEPVRAGGQVVGVLEVGRETDAKESLAFAAQIIAGSIPAILLFAAAGGWWLAGRALNPIDRITRTAASIEECDLSRRIGIDLPDDEVGRLAETFNAMLDRIERAFARQRQFTADAAHELRTPLALMRSQIDVALQAERRPDADRETLEALGADVDRLSRMAASLLSLARSDAGGLTLEREPVDLADLLGLLAEQYRPIGAESEIAISLDAQPITVEADQDLLTQVLVNLLDNAMRYAPAGSEVGLGCRAGDGVVRIWVSDEGPGIPPEHLPHIFERFYRVETGRTRAGSSNGGIGLGLAISKTIVEAHGGEIKVESAPGLGTTVIVELALTNE